MIQLESYVCGSWNAGSGDPKPLHDPTTEAVLGEVRPGGIDFKAVLAHAQEQGGPALRRLTFAERGAMLKGIAGVVHEHRDELIKIAGENGGNTRGDAKFDLDGASGTLAFYAKLGETLQPQHLLDGDVDQLGRSPRFSGQHILVPRPGVAVHINAFNFPAWGMGEKMACALLAGMPVIEKAGHASALLAYRIAQLIVESGLVPEGAFQFLPGSVSKLLDELGPMDTVAFTGSAATGALIRGNRNLVQRNVRVNVEADSINSAILGPDAETDSDTLEQFLTNVTIDMTQKAGQKCTAVRRIFVPNEMVDDVCSELAARLESTAMGNPLDKDVRMGPVASKAQFDDVRAGIDQLTGVAGMTIVTGGSEPARDTGFFVKPTLLRSQNGDADLLHELEVFGPCATVIPYSGSADEVVGLVNRGGGSLVASVYSDDKKFVDTVVRGIAPWHGRVWLGSEKTMGQALGPGAVLPGSIHGGPGRAGGGEELGGLRGLMPYLQRTALQGDRAVLTKIFGPKDKS